MRTALMAVEEGDGQICKRKFGLEIQESPFN